MMTAIVLLITLHPFRKDSLLFQTQKPCLVWRHAKKLPCCGIEEPNLILGYDDLDPVHYLNLDGFTHLAFHL